jgi:hypothetical protein
MMTKRHRSGAPVTPPPRVDAAEYPRLTVFFEGYLHQDFVVEHGDAAGALRAYRNDLPADARAELDEERVRLGALLSGHSLRVARRVIAALGAAWWSASLAEVRSVLSDSPPAWPPGAGHHHQRRP